MRVLVTPNAQYRQGHAQSVLAALGIEAILTDAAGNITAEMTEQQFSLFVALRAGAHQCRILNCAVPVPAPATEQIRFGSSLEQLRSYRHPRLDGRKTGRKLPLLTARQMQIAECVSEGMSNKQIAFQLGLSEGTVRVYLAKTFDRVNVKNRLGLAFLFREQFAGAPKPQNEPSHVADGDIRMGAFE